MLRLATQHPRYRWHKRQAKNHSLWCSVTGLIADTSNGSRCWTTEALVTWASCAHPFSPLLFPAIFSRILSPQSIIKPSKCKVLQGKKCGVSWAAKSQPTLPCFQVQVAQALQTTYSSRGACLLVGGWGRTCLACVYGMKDIFSTKMRADHSTTFYIHHLNKPLFHWMILQLWVRRTITHIIHLDIVFIMNHFEMVLKIKEMAAHVLCVCVTAKGFERNSFFIYG